MPAGCHIFRPYGEGKRLQESLGLAARQFNKLLEAMELGDVLVEGALPERFIVEHGAAHAVDHLGVVAVLYEVVENLDLRLALGVGVHPTNVFSRLPAGDARVHFVELAVAVIGVLRKRDADAAALFGGNLEAFAKVRVGRVGGDVGDDVEDVERRRFDALTDFNFPHAE